MYVFYLYQHSGYECFSSAVTCLQIKTYNQHVHALVSLCGPTKPLMARNYKCVGLLRVCNKLFTRQVKHLADLRTVNEKCAPQTHGAARPWENFQLKPVTWFQWKVGCFVYMTVSFI